MESIIARALEYTLKYWLKSFSRDQFKLQGRTAQLSNLGEFLHLGRFHLYLSNSDLRAVPVIVFFCALDINGDALHSSVGLPPALNVAKAKVGRLQITVR